MGKKSRDKGKRGERAARDQCRKYWNSGDKCIRAAQANGKFSCDLLGALPESHVEVKFYQRIVATDFMEQAKEDAEEGQIPIVIMKQNGGEWMCMIRMQDSVAFAKRLADNFDGVITR